MLSVTGMVCCAGRQILGLSTYRKDAKRAMLDFCKFEFHRNGVYQAGRFEPNVNKCNRLYTFYLFNGIVGYKDGSTEGLGYVEAFRDFIRANNLGQVIDTETGFNRINEPTHNIMMCLWKPKPTVLRKWYLENRG